VKHIHESHTKWARDVNSFYPLYFETQCPMCDVEEVLPDLDSHGASSSNLQ